MPRDVSEQLVALARIHDELWDPKRNLCRLAPGAIGMVDTEPIDLHPIRETALGAVLDLMQGNAARAEDAITEVLAHQYDAPGRPWDGTFRVTAQDREPPWPGARQWRDYDPNWRQFLGCILGFIDLEYGDQLRSSTREGIARALRGCVRGEPEDRIPEWYTNPNLLQAWLLGHVGRNSEDAELIAAGERRRRMVMARCEQFGDVDEYNSPTYDGIDLWAALLWIVYPPTPAARADGLRLAELLLRRIEDLYHPGLAVICGPYARVYGLHLSDYVSLLGVVLRVLGVGDAVLPADLNLGTDHVHDLYFLPILSALAARATEVTVHPHVGPHRRIQRFGEVVATSVRTSGVCSGWENDRVVTFSRDQYVPVSVHCGTSAEQVEAVAVMLGRSEVSVHAEPVGDPVNPSGLQVQITALTNEAEPVVDVRLLASTALELVVRPDVTAELCGLNGITLTCSPVPTHLESTRRAMSVVTTLEVASQGLILEIMWNPVVNEGPSS